MNAMLTEWAGSSFWGTLGRNGRSIFKKRQLRWGFPAIYGRGEGRSQRILPASWRSIRPCGIPAALGDYLAVWGNMRGNLRDWLVWRIDAGCVFSTIPHRSWSCWIKSGAKKSSCRRRSRSRSPLRGRAGMWRGYSVRWKRDGSSKCSSNPVMVPGRPGRRLFGGSLRAGGWRSTPVPRSIRRRDGWWIRSVFGHFGKRKRSVCCWIGSCSWMWWWNAGTRKPGIRDLPMICGRWCRMGSWISCWRGSPKVRSQTCIWITGRCRPRSWGFPGRSWTMSWECAKRRRPVIRDWGAQGSISCWKKGV